MTEPVYFLKLELENVRCFKEKTRLDLSDGKGNWKKWTVILGDNGTGKTTILQILAACEIMRGTISSGSTDFIYFPIGFLNSNNEIEDYYPGETTETATAYISNSPEIIQLNFYNNQQYSSSIHSNEIINLKCFGYGANRRS